MTPLSRRRTLAAGLAGAAAVGLRPWRSLVDVAPAAGSAAATADPAARLVALLRDPSRAAAVGRAWSGATGSGATGSGAPKGLVARLGGADAVARLSDRRLHEALRRAVSDDFAADRTVVVDGWILADTEVRLAALAADALA